jgi:non-ribosomal peptide synthetase component E (peptide arylation enzyme)
MGRSMASLAGGNALKQLATDMPHMEAVRYEHKNVKWTFHHIDYFADALATGIVETGIAPGDVVLSWLPLHFAEQVRYSHFVLMKTCFIYILLFAHSISSLFSFLCSTLFSLHVPRRVWFSIGWILHRPLRIQRVPRMP